MRWERFALIFLLICSLTGCGIFDNRPISKIEVERNELITEPIFAIDCIENVNGKLGGMHCGTAFITTYKNQPVLITANHVIPDGPDTLIGFRTKNNKFVNLKFGRAYKIPDLDVVIFFITWSDVRVVPYEPVKYLDSYIVVSRGFIRKGKFYKPFPYSNFGKIQYIFGGKLYTTCRVYPGMSGGPLLRHDKVYAITTHTTSEGAMHTPLSLVFKMLDIKESEKGRLLTK